MYTPYQYDIRKLIACNHFTHWWYDRSLYNLVIGKALIIFKTTLKTRTRKVQNNRGNGDEIGSPSDESAKSQASLFKTSRITPWEPGYIAGLPKWTDGCIVRFPTRKIWYAYCSRSFSLIPFRCRWNHTPGNLCLYDFLTCS